MNQTKINHALAELLTHEELLAYRKGCHFAATMAALLAEPVPAESAQIEPEAEPHAELRKTWLEGQRWQFCAPWGKDWADFWPNNSPAWLSDTQYRRHPDDLPKPDADGWIAHGGGECPVAGDALVIVRMRNGREAGGQKARAWYWRHAESSSNGDITHYRLA